MLEAVATPPLICEATLRDDGVTPVTVTVAGPEAFVAPALSVAFALNV